MRPRTQDILPGSPQMRHAGWKPVQSAWFAHAWPKLHAATSSVYAAARCRVTVPDLHSVLAVACTTSLRIWRSVHGARRYPGIRAYASQCWQSVHHTVARSLRAGDSVAHSAVLMELGLWRVETRHKMYALRLLRDILLGDPSSQLRAIYYTYLQCCVALESELHSHARPSP